MALHFPSWYFSPSFVFTCVSPRAAPRAVPPPCVAQAIHNLAEHDRGSTARESNPLPYELQGKIYEVNGAPRGDVGEKNLREVVWRKCKSRGRSSQLTQRYSREGGGRARDTHPDPEDTCQHRDGDEPLNPATEEEEEEEEEEGEGVM
ncbi:hypothetical protein E2C01_040204 [Portunus trituberculatus]|uniref:Uncharacterized protein n=1 Tax=Portunus trituberculatus TaxID=210409 RepID=A0A5B7FQ37_PORTR|nr:hypothetical protein [Portunus trituberculatus]